MQYLGIWNTDPRKTVVWVANGNHPIISGTGKLCLSSDGTLFLGDITGRDIWSTGSQLSRVEPQACLLDIGLLVINDTRTGKLLWQSLYQLSDTLLPFVPLGYTKLLDSMLEFQLTSWNITGIDPSSGQYVRKLDPSRRYALVAYRGSDVTYRSGPWNGTRWNGFPKMTQDSVRFFLNKSGDNGALYWYEPINLSVPWRFVMNSNGTTYRYFLNGSDWIEFWKAPDESTPSYALCGPYGIYIDGNCKCCEESLFHPKNEKDWKKRIFAGGCIRNVPLNDTHPGFVTLTNVKLPDTINAISDERKSKSECASWCQKNSSCMAYAYIGWQGCLAWFGDIIDMQKFLNAGDDLYIRVASNSESIYRKTHLIILSLSIAAVLVLLAVVIILVWKFRRTPQKNMIIRWIKTRWPFQRTPQTVVGNHPANGREVRFFEIFDFNTIIAATSNFRDMRIIGRGQLGPVYKGILENGEEIAVKRAPRNAHNGSEQLNNELNLIARLKHKHLVKLTGYCIQQQEIILCFEFMHNHSLDQLLFGMLYIFVFLFRFEV
ncbi:G-type lectin S-receptor-like serine/threonine-protein kinase RKS1 [Carex rostrata]